MVVMIDKFFLNNTHKMKITADAGRGCHCIIPTGVLNLYRFTYY